VRSNFGQPPKRSYALLPRPPNERAPALSALAAAIAAVPADRMAAPDHLASALWRLAPVGTATRTAVGELLQLRSIAPHRATLCGRLVDRMGRPAPIESHRKASLADWRPTTSGAGARSPPVYVGRMATPVDELDSDLLAELAEFRRDLHANPELGFQETRTATRVAAALRACGVDVTEGIGGTGLVGTIRGVGSGDGSIGLRADMDALSLVEETGLPYASRTPGLMHGCAGFSGADHRA
jgi:hypothetical protein